MRNNNLFRLLFCLLFIVLIASCSDYQTRETSTTLPTETPIFLVPNFSKEFFLSPTTKAACATERDLLSRSEASKPSVLKNILDGAPNRFACAQALGNDVLHYFSLVSKYIREEISKPQLFEPYDIVIIGAGPYAAILATNLRKYSDLTAIVIEKEHVFSLHFCSTIFNLLTSEKPGKSYNPFPNSPVTLKDILGGSFVGKTYPLAIDLWHEIAFTLFASNIGYLQGEVATVRIKDAITDDRLYSIEIKSGLNIKTRSIVFATGLGEATASLDQSTLDLLKSARVTSAKSPLPPMIYIDHFIEWAELKRRAVVSGFDELAGKDIAVVGGGNGGKMLVKYLKGAAPLQAYAPGGSTALPNSITWFTAKSGGGGILQHVAGKVTSIQYAKQIDGRPGVKINYDTNPLGKTAHHVIVAGGYKSKLEEILSPMLSGVPAASVMTDVKGKPLGLSNVDVLARRLTINGKPEQIFFVGSAMENKVAGIHLFAHKTASFANILADILGESD